MSKEEQLPPVMPQKKTWKEVVAMDKNRIFLPDQFKGEAESIEKERTAYREEVNKMAKRQLEINMRTNNLFLAVRQYLAKNGIKDIWMKDIGYEEAALKENEFVINITEPQQN